MRHKNWTVMQTLQVCCCYTDTKRGEVDFRKQRPSLRVMLVLDFATRCNHCICVSAEELLCFIKMPWISETVQLCFAAALPLNQPTRLVMESARWLRRLYVAWWSQTRYRFTVRQKIAFHRSNTISVSVMFTNAKDSVTLNTSLFNKQESCSVNNSTNQFKSLRHM